MSPSSNTLRKNSPMFGLLLLAMTSGSACAWQYDQRSQAGDLVAVSPDLQNLYQKTDHAESVADYSMIYDHCRNVSGDRTRSPEDRQYARTLMSWAANRRGEARSDQAGEMVRLQELDKAAELDSLALQDFETAIQLDGTRWRAHHNLAIHRALQGDNAAAIQGFNRVVALKPDFPDAYFNRGELLFRAGNFKDSIADYNKVIELKPEDSAAFSGRAHALYATGKTEEALADYAKATQLSPQSVDALTEYADTCQALGKWKEAATAYQQAMQLDGQNARVLQNAAWMMATCPDDFYRNGKSALSTAQKAVQLASGVASAQTLDVLAAAQAASGDFASAQRSVAEALRSTTDPSLRNELIMRSKLYERKRSYVQPKP